MLEINPLVWETSAKPTADYKLILTFSNGSVKVFDCKPLIERYKFFAPLRNEAVFANFALDGWTATWLDGQIDIAPEYLFSEGIAA